MRSSVIASLTCFVLLAGSVSARPAPGPFMQPLVQPIPQRMLQADTVVVGKVTTVAEKPTKAERFKGDAQKADYRLFTIKIDSALKGGNGLTHIKVGCLVPMGVAPVVPGVIDDQPIRKPFPGRPIRPFPIQQLPMLEKDQEVLLFLRPHVSEPFYTISAMGDVTDSKAGNFKADVELARKVSKIWAEPMTSLKAKEPADRYQAAAVLVMKYRTPVGPAKEEEVSVEESKLILEGIASGNWDAPQVGRFDSLTPMQVFYQLQPQTAGFVQPQNFQEQPKAMKKWLEDNAGKFRVKRFVAAKSE